MPDPTEIFLTIPPGLEPEAAEEARAQGFAVTGTLPGGVTVAGGWAEVARANRDLRGPVRVLARIGAFRAMHLAQLDKRARKFPFAEVLRPEIPVAVEAHCTKSRIYHEGAAAQRIAGALEAAGFTVADGAPVRVMARIDDDLCTISLDATGEPLHIRGHKQAVGKAPLRENLAALFLMRCGYRGDMPVVDPMCGSGTIPVEAAEIALGLAPGRSRRFAFQDFAVAAPLPPLPARRTTALRFRGFDRDDGAIRAATANAARAGVEGVATFRRQPVSDLVPPEGPPGLVLVNPPYGGRIGERRLLHGLYGALGAVLRARFRGWRVGVITSDAGLAATTGLPFMAPGPPVPHGGLRIALYRTEPLA